MAEWMGHAKIRFTTASEPLELKTVTGQRTDLLKIAEQSTPPCKLNPLLFNGHLQTAYTAVKSDGPPVYYKRKIFDAEDPAYHGTFAVDFVVPPYENPDPALPPRTKEYSMEELENFESVVEDSRPMLICLHGLSGGSYEIYLRHVLAPLIKEGTGWEACVVNSRGCANHKITSSILYNARATWDIRQFVKWARQKFPNRPLFGIGFSLGANILTNYVGEEGDKCELKAAVVISNPWNLDVSNKALQRSYIGKEVYSKVMGNNLKRLVEFHAEQIEKNPNISLERIRKVKYLHEFDREVQCPTWGYPTEGAYYRDASSVDVLMAVRIPLFAINAIDDPIAVDEAIPYGEFKRNPYTVLCTTSLGGHLSWFENNHAGDRWHAKPASNILDRMAKEVDLKSVIPREIQLGPETLHSKSTFNPIRRKLYVHDE
jgi:predicted alpha/beta-fold hydrolase